MYDSLPYANLTLRINRPWDEGPGLNLFDDPINPGAGLFVGNSINRQSFDTQFILDMEYAVGISRKRVYVTNVKKGDVHFSWEATNVIVEFILLERNSTQEKTLMEVVSALTILVQTPGSRLYNGTNVTSDIDPLWGLEVLTWDISLRLMYPIEVIGSASVIDGYYLNQGGLEFCDGVNAILHISYCEFERFFEDDVAEALGITYQRIQILFVKKSSMDSSLVHFRVLPPEIGSTELSISASIAELMYQVGDKESALYAGNVTIRVDPVWGVSNNGPALRKNAALFSYKYYEYDERHLSTGRVPEIRRPPPLVTDYDRCKANRRCNWGEKTQDQATNDVVYHQRMFERGEKKNISIFLDFEDWRMGTRGFSWDGNIPPTKEGASSISDARAMAGTIRGAHFWPFDQDSLGPDIPCYLQERNQGLVLDRRLHHVQTGYQEALVYDLEGRVEWIEENIEWARMDAVRRSRRDVRHYMIGERTHFTHWLENERLELQELNTSQCAIVSCYLLFNTTSLELSGAISDKGVVRYTDAGTEVAVFSFNSIYLGPDVKVEMVGQRAISLVSKTAFILNTTFRLTPGTLGGFPGGYSVARKVDEAFIDSPRDILICDLVGACNDNTSYTPVTPEERAALISNNVNGPGSGNLRVHPFVVRTAAADVDEVQTVTTRAQNGQTLAGGFRLHFGGYSTPLINHDATAAEMKHIIEDNLNIFNPADFPITSDRYNGGIAGVGAVNVTRSAQDDQEGYTWSITFTSAIGNIEQLRVTNFLQGLKNDVYTRTIVDGNELGGTFSILFQDYVTEPINHNETAAGLQRKLMALPSVRTAYVIRSDPVMNCDDGLCRNGPFQARGLIWTIYITTDAETDNTTPASPSSPLAAINRTLSFLDIGFEGLTGINASAVLTRGLAESPDIFLSKLDIDIPFSLAWGGGGGSFGGLGGRGYGPNPVGPTYSDQRLTDLVGGSGGCMRSAQPFEINSIRGDVMGRGGSGGGAIELIAANDITVGTYGKIIARGGDGEQTSEGGGGGGSGGGILLAAGGVVYVEGELDASGGSGGYGGPGVGTERSRASQVHYWESQGKAQPPPLAGGGGGGGRIAIFAESITNIGSLSAAGGKCGIYKIPVNMTVLEVNVTIEANIRGLIDEENLVTVVATFINITLDTQFVDIRYVEIIGKETASLNYTIILNENTDMDQVTSLLAAAADTNLADVIMTKVYITSSRKKQIMPTMELPTDCDNGGSSGGVFTEATMTTSMAVLETDAAEGTSKSLFLSNNEVTNTTTGTPREAPFAWNGPILPFVPSQPTRVTYYSRMVSVEGESQKANFGTLFTLLSRGVEGLNVSSVIGVFIGDKIKHGSNFVFAVDESIFLKRLKTIDEYPAFDRWYKIDIHIRWDTHTYFILLDDTLVVKDQTFEGDDIDGIRLSTDRATNVWFDEIYVGFDNNLDFECPNVERGGARTGIPVQRAWTLDEVNAVGSEGYTQVDDMTRHYNHLDPTIAVKFDGQGQVKVFEDIKFKFPSGDYPAEVGKLHAGSLRYLTNSRRSGRRPNGNSATLVNPKGLWYLAKDGPGTGGAGDGRQYWYTEHNVNINSDTYSLGGIAACSSQDLRTWRYEGFVMHYENLTDMVHGVEGPFQLDRPTVLFNSDTNKYVLWATMNDLNRTLGMSAVAESPYEDGPFMFLRSLFPDGNRTRDQAAFLSNGEAVLARTYYSTVEYIAPEAIMQPVWESVKNRDGSTNYAMNYHRASYDIGYDNYHDIYLQRWRNEDKAHDVKCVNWITGESRSIEYGVYENDAVCRDPEEYKIVLGQGNPPVQTRFLSPNSSDNSWWIQTSVPAVKAQPWASSYRDGYCGIRELKDFLEELSPDLATFVPNDLGNCSNIADNPVHNSLQDKLLGVQRVVMQRRAKYVAISELSDDYLDTTGIQNSFEGELSSGHLTTMIASMGQFGFGPGNQIRSTDPKVVRSGYETAYDYRSRFRQYIVNKNDRAQYSLACVVDGVCPNNFKDHLTFGNI